MQALSGHELQGSLCADMGPVPRPLLLHHQQHKQQQRQRPRLRGRWRRAHRGRWHRCALPGPRGLLDQARLRRLGRGGQGNTRSRLSFTRPYLVVISSHFNLPFANHKTASPPLSLPRCPSLRHTTPRHRFSKSGPSSPRPSPALRVSARAASRQRCRRRTLSARTTRTSTAWPCRPTTPSSRRPAR